MNIKGFTLYIGKTPAFQMDDLRSIKILAEIMAETKGEPVKLVNNLSGNIIFHN